jgi:Bacterial tandem repeat domain 1
VDISSAQLSGAIAAQALAGRRVWALDAYRHSGAVQFAALFGASGAATSASPQNTSANHQTEMTAQRAAGHDTRVLTGVESGGPARFVGVWTQ